MTDLENSVSCELQSIIEQVGENPTVNESADSIKLKLSSALTEIKIYTENKKRINLRPKNAFLKTGGIISVWIQGKEGNTRSIMSKGASVVIWNDDHELNVGFKSPLSIKSAQSSEHLAFLSFLNQAKEIGLKQAMIFSSSGYISKLFENIHLYHAQNYMQGSTEMPNKFILQKIWEILQTYQIQLSFKSPPFTDIFQPTHEKLAKIAKEKIKDLMN